MDYSSCDDETDSLLTSCQEANISSQAKDEPPPEKSYYDKKFVPIEIVVFLTFLGSACSLPISQFFIFDSIAKQYGGVNISSQNPCGNSSGSDVQRTIQGKAADQLMYLTFVGTIPAVIPTLFLGSFTDRLGRKFALLLSVGCSCLRSVVYLLVLTLDLRIEYLYIGSTIDGLSGGFGMILMASFGIVADITPPDSTRALRVTSTEFALASSASLSFLICGFWIKASKYVHPMIFSLSLTVAAFLGVVFFIPETNLARKRLHGGPERSILSLVKKTFQLYTKDTSERRRWKLCLLLFTFFIATAISVSKNNVTTLYLLNVPFCWPELKVTVYTAIRLIVGFMFDLILIRVLGRYFRDSHFAILGCLSSFSMYVFFGTAFSDAFIYTAAALGMFGDVTSAMIRSLMSRLVKSDEQGALFASVGVVEMLFTAVGGLMATSVYHLSLSFFPGLLFLIFAFCQALALGLFIVYTCKSPREATVSRVVDVSAD